MSKEKNKKIGAILVTAEEVCLMRTFFVVAILVLHLILNNSIARRVKSNC